MFVTCAVFAIAIISAVATGCGKKSESPYGPGGEWVDNLRERITKNIEDHDKSIKLLEQVDRIEAVLMDMDDTVLGFYARLNQLDANYHSTREDFQKEIDSFNEYRHKKVNELISISKEMKKISGRSDWEKVSDMDKTLYESWQRSYGS
jgi:hypothetical protein